MPKSHESHPREPSPIIPEAQQRKDHLAREIFVQTWLTSIAFPESDNADERMTKWTNSSWPYIFRQLVEQKNEIVEKFLANPTNEKLQQHVWDLMQKRLH